MKKNNLTWDDVRDNLRKRKKVENKKQKELSSENQIELLTTPELVMEYIKRYPLNDENQIKLLTTPELVMEYIKHHELSSEKLNEIIKLHGGKNEK